MTMVVADKHMYFEQPADPGMTTMFQAKNTAFSKTGIDTVAGFSCTTYDASIGDRKGQVCLTIDGVLLHAGSLDLDSHRELAAVKVTYGDQRPVMFEPPAGFQKLDPAAMSRGMVAPMMAPPPPGGGPRGGVPGGQLGRWFRTR